MNIQTRGKTYGVAAILGLSIGGCGNVEDLDGSTGSTTSALRSQILATDASGTVHIEIVSCTTDALRGTHTHDLCPVDPGRRGPAARDECSLGWDMTAA